MSLQVRSYINAAHNDEIIFTRGATESINMVSAPPATIRPTRPLTTVV